MKNVSKINKHLLVAGLLCITVIIAASWQTDNKKSKEATINNAAGDTTLPKQHSGDKDEFRMNELDNAMKQLDIQLKQLDLQMKDMHENISKQIQEALADVDVDKINKELEDNIKK